MQHHGPCSTGGSGQPLHPQFYREQFVLFTFNPWQGEDMQQPGLTTQRSHQKVWFAISWSVPGKSSCEIFTEIRNRFSCMGKTEISVNLAELRALETLFGALCFRLLGERQLSPSAGSPGISEAFWQGIVWGRGSCPHQPFSSNPAVQIDEETGIRNWLQNWWGCD